MHKEKILNNVAEIEKSRAISDGKLLSSGANYEIDEETGNKRLVPTKEQIQRIQEEVEAMLKKGILSKENLSSGDLEISFEEGKEMIEYEFEIENEQRIMIDPELFPIGGWDDAVWMNHVVDTYDQSGRCRIRIKNNDPRLSLKVPLLSKDDERSKCCVRLEFKPTNENQKKELFKIRDLIADEEGTRIHAKKGTPLKLNNGQKVWINRDEEGSHWIETDDIAKIEDFLPEGIKYLGHRKSKIKIKPEEKETNEINYEDFRSALIDNFKATSRTVNGVADISISEKKHSPKLKGESLVKKAEENLEEIGKFIWENQNREINDEKDVEILINSITKIVNQGFAEDVLAYRTWDVPYGRKITPEKIEAEMKIFYRNLFEKIREAQNGELQPSALGRWIELEIDRNIHPYADGCGRVAKALSAFFFARYNKPMPVYGTRDKYYKAMNSGEEIFREYYNDSLGLKK